MSWVETHFRLADFSRSEILTATASATAAASPPDVLTAQYSFESLPEFRIEYGVDDWIERRVEVAQP